MQLLAAYNVFNNDGFYITPRLAEKFYQNGRFTNLDDDVKRKNLSSEAAKTMQNVLINVIEKGTGKRQLHKVLLQEVKQERQE